MSANSTPSQAPSQDTTNTSGAQGTPGSDDASGYPPQIHAGKVGYGPNYNQSPDFIDRVTGAKEIIGGKIKRHPDEVHRGHERMTGELKKKERQHELEDDGGPFSTAGEEKEDKQPKDIQLPSQAGKPSDGMRSGTERGDKEQAATTAPEGTAKAESQREGGNAQSTKDIG